jgi:phage shock protein PspC (stress-responsive transcriptional regulator)
MNKKLYRSRKNRTIGGVAAGLAEYFDIDPTLVRIIFVVSLFMGGSGFVAYILLWIIVPEEPYPIFTSTANTGTSSAENSGTTSSENTAPDTSPDAAPYDSYLKKAEERKHKRLVFLGIGLIMAGLFFLADNFIPHIHFTDFFSLVLIAIGIGLLLNSKKLNIN